GVYQAAPVTRNAGGLLHHRFTLTPLARGGLFSVALSRGSPRVAVSNHPALWSPDVPRQRVPADATARSTRPSRRPSYVVGPPTPPRAMIMKDVRGSGTPNPS